MNRRTLTILGIAVLLLAAVPFIYAQTPHRGMMHGQGMGQGMNQRMGHAGMGGPLAHLGRLKTELGLSDQQVTQIKAIFQATQDQNATYREQLRGGFGEIANTLIQNPNNLDAAQSLLDKQEQAQHAIKVNMLTATSKALNVLTPDQRTKLSQLLADRQAKWQARKGH